MSTVTAAARTEIMALVADGLPCSRGVDAGAQVLLVLDDQPVAVPLGDLATQDVVVAHEARDELGGRPRRDRERIGDLLDARVVHDDDPIRHRERLFLVVRDVDEHQPELALEVAELDPHAQLEQAVEVAERLVEQQRLGLRHQHAGEGDTLLLPTRQGARLAVGERFQADHLEGSHRLLPPLLLPDPVHLQPELDVLERRPVREEREVLEDRRRGPLVRRQVDERLAVEEDLALGRELVTADHPQRRRLPAARRAEQDDVLAVVDVQVDVVDGDRAAGEDLRQSDEVEPRLSGRRGRRAPPPPDCTTPSLPCGPLGGRGSRSRS